MILPSEIKKENCFKTLESLSSNRRVFSSFIDFANPFA